MFSVICSSFLSVQSDSVPFPVQLDYRNTSDVSTESKMMRAARAVLLVTVKSGKEFKAVTNIRVLQGGLRHTPEEKKRKKVWMHGSCDPKRM